MKFIITRNGTTRARITCCSFPRRLDRQARCLQALVHRVRAGARFAQWDFSVFKNIPVAESKDLQLRAEFFNLFNHPNFQLPNSDISSPTFGQIQQALPPRLIQLALRCRFCSVKPRTQRSSMCSAQRSIYSGVRGGLCGEPVAGRRWRCR
jgi:hypothetical protein